MQKTPLIRGVFSRSVKALNSLCLRKVGARTFPPRRNTHVRLPLEIKCSENFVPVTDLFNYTPAIGGVRVVGLAREH